MDNVVTYWEEHCPNLMARVDADAEKGDFNYLWPVHGLASDRYFEALIGRKIRGEEKPEKVFDEIEGKLSK